MIIFIWFSLYCVQLIQTYIKNIFNLVISQYISSINFLLEFYMFTNRIGHDAFLIDFIQKKSTNKWVQKFLIFSANLFNERLLFDFITFYIINLVIWSLHKLFLFEINNVHNLFMITFVLFKVMSLSLLLLFIYCLIF